MKSKKDESRQKGEKWDKQIMVLQLLAYIFVPLRIWRKKEGHSLQILNQLKQEIEGWNEFVIQCYRKF